MPRLEDELVSYLSCALPHFQSVYINPIGEDFGNHNYMSKIADDQVDQSCCKVDGIQFENYFHAPTPKSGGGIFDAQPWAKVLPKCGWATILGLAGSAA